MTLLGLSTSTLLLLSVAALLTGMLHGAIGLAGGVLMAAILAHIIGIKAAVPIMTFALIFSHGSRVILYRAHTDWPVTKIVLIFSLPTIMLGAYVFTLISPRTVAVVFAVFLSASFPIKYWAKEHNLKTGPRLLAGASAIWGMLAGNVIGPGFFLAPFLQGTGMNRMSFVGTVAIVTLAMNITKLIVFGANGLISSQWLLLGLLIGLLTIPGNIMGKRLLQKMTDTHHSHLINLFTVGMIINFAYLAWRG